MPKSDSSSIEEKLDIIIEYMRRVDKRDRLRMWGGFFRSLITLLPIIFMVWSAWYFYEHGEELLMQISKYAAQSAAEITQQQGNEVLEKLKLNFSGGNP